MWITAATGLLACGLFLPEGILIGRQVVLRTPVGDFAQEVRALDGPKDGAPALPPGLTREEAVKINSRQYGDKAPPAQLEIELTELGEVLTQHGIAETRRSQLLAEYKNYRDKVEKHDPNHANDYPPPELIPFDEQAAKARQTTADAGSTPAPSPAGFRTKLSAELVNVLPEEWQDYLEGADFFNAAGGEAGARTAWERLLARPQAERLARSTWAAYMLARMQESAASPAESAAHYQRVRELRAAGCGDALNLAAASLGWEARLALKAKDYSAAARLYYLQAAGGRLDADSLRTVAAAVLGDGKADGSATFVDARDPVAVADQSGEKTDEAALLAAARDPFLRRVVTLYLACHTYFDSADPPQESKGNRWLAALSKVEVDRIREAAQVAWAAYEVGEYYTASQWLRLAPGDEPLALWLRAKLALRDGKSDEAAKNFARAVHAYPVKDGRDAGEEPDTRLVNFDSGFRAKQFQLDFGIVQLSRGDFHQALTSLLRSEYWDDAAYVAERVLTPSELARYVREKYPQAPPAKPDSAPAPTPDPSIPEQRRAVEFALRANLDRDQSTDPVGFSLRYLLARRLARLGRYAEARTYYPAALLPVFDEYVAARKLGESSPSKSKRAAGLWGAAKIHRQLGMELFGTEGGPDGYVWGGNLEMGGYRETRLQIPSKTTPGEMAPDSANPTPTPSPPFVPPVGAEEKRRIAKDEVQPNKRYHYRYVAAELAWRAAALMPDQQEETARVLYTGGSWLEHVDAAKAADRFYIALLRRCGKTETGRAADKSGHLWESEENY